MRTIIFIAFISFIWVCSSPKTQIFRSADLADDFKLYSPKVKLKPVLIYGNAEKNIKAFDTIHLTVNQAKRLIYSLQNEAFKQYELIKSISNSTLYEMKTFNKLLNIWQFNYLRNNIEKGEHYISNDFITKELSLPDSFITSYPKLWEDFPPKERKFYETHIEIQFFPLLGDSASLDLFAIALGYQGAWANYVLFFKKNKLLGYKKIEHHYGMDNAYLKAAVIKQDTILCFRENFASGTGIWWYENFFYLIENDSIKPIQSLISEGNLSMLPILGYAKYLNLETVSCNPLKFKAYYKFNIHTGRVYPYHSRTIFNDTVILTYKWNVVQRRFIPSHNKLDSLQLYSFSPNADINLFVYAYRKELIRNLYKKEYKNWILWFLQNYFDVDDYKTMH